MILTLNIYGKDDEIVKTYKTNHIRWRLFTDAIKLNDEIKDAEPATQIAAVGEFIKRIFIGLTDDELELADAFDVFNTFNMIVGKARSIKSGTGKNA